VVVDEGAAFAGARCLQQVVGEVEALARGRTSGWIIGLSPGATSPADGRMLGCLSFCLRQPNLSSRGACIIRAAV
jgi:hypothetical protein